MDQFNLQNEINNNNNYIFQRRNRGYIRRRQLRDDSSNYYNIVDNSSQLNNENRVLYLLPLPPSSLSSSSSSSSLIEMKALSQSDDGTKNSDNFALNPIRLLPSSPNLQVEQKLGDQQLFTGAGNFFEREKVPRKKLSRNINGNEYVAENGSSIASMTKSRISKVSASFSSLLQSYGFETPYDVLTSKLFSSSIPSSTVLLWDYVIFLNLCLVSWILYLSIPKRLVRKVLPRLCVNICTSKRRFRKPNMVSKGPRETMLIPPPITLSQQQQQPRQQQIHSEALNQTIRQRRQQQQQQQQATVYPQRSMGTTEYSTQSFLRYSPDKSFDGEVGNSNLRILSSHDEEEQRRLRQLQQQQFQTLNALSSDTMTTSLEDSIFMNSSTSSAGADDEAGYFVNVSLPQYRGQVKTAQQQQQPLRDDEPANEDRANYTIESRDEAKDSPVAASPTRIQNLSMSRDTNILNEPINISQLQDSVIQSTERVRRRREQRHAELQGSPKQLSSRPSRSPTLARISSRDSPERAERRMRLAALSSSSHHRHPSGQRNLQQNQQLSAIQLRRRRSASTSPTRSDLVRDAIISQLLREKSHQQLLATSKASIPPTTVQQQIGFETSNTTTSSSHMRQPYNRLEQSDNNSSTSPRRPQVDEPYSPARVLYDGSTSTDYRGRASSRSGERLDSSFDDNKDDVLNISAHSDTRHDFLTRWKQQHADNYVSPPTSTSSGSNTTNYIPSPAHPSTTHRVPPNHIVLETMKRLQSRGIRLLAHGIHVLEPKRVWVKFNSVGGCIEWQSESPRTIVTGGGMELDEGSKTIILVRGTLHKIPVSSILYIDVGQKTLAFLKPKESNVIVPSASCCFSLLTNDGSLDLQTNSKLERDALVSCLCWIMDYTQGSDAWRRLYEESSVGGTGNKLDFNESRSLQNHYKQQIYASLSGLLLKQVVSHIQEPPIHSSAEMIALSAAAGLGPKYISRPIDFQRETSGSPYSGISSNIIPLSAEEI